MSNKCLPMLAITVCSVIHFPCRADVIFSDKATFLAATGATSATGPLSDVGLIPGGPAATVTVGKVTFTIAGPSFQLFIGLGGDCMSVPGCDWTPLLPGPDIAISDIENLNADLSMSGPVTAMGFDFVKPIKGFSDVANPGPSEFTVTLLNGGNLVSSFVFDTPSAAFPADTADFVGVMASNPFNRMQIRETTGGIDDEYFGQFYTASVPEPTSISLICSGLVGVISLKRAWLRTK